MSVSIIMFAFSLVTAIVSFFLTSRAPIFYNFYIESWKIIYFSLKNSCKSTNISGKKAGFLVLNTVATLPIGQGVQDRVIYCVRFRMA